MERRYGMLRTGLSFATAVAVVFGVALAGTDIAPASAQRVRAPSSLGLVRVTRVVEADTVFYEQGPRESVVRLHNALSPKRDACFAEPARLAAAAYLVGRWVRVVPAERGVSGRVAAWLQVDGADVGEWLVERGLAFARYNATIEGRGFGLRLAEERARTAGLGMWGRCFRPGHLRISEVDPAKGRLWLRSTIDDGRVDGWRLRSLTSGASIRLDAGVLPAGTGKRLGIAALGGVSRRFREPILLERRDGTWASVWAGDPPRIARDRRAYGVYYAESADFGVLRQLGVNLVVLPFHPGLRAQLDEAYAHGIGVVAIGGDWLRGEGDLARARPRVASRQIRTVRDHPALWGYNTVDEPAHRRVPLDVLRGLYRAAKDQDNTHPVVVVFDQVATFGTAANPFERGVADVAAFDIYAVNTQGYQPWIQRFLPDARSVVERRSPETDVWLIGQGFGEGRLVLPTAAQFTRQVEDAARYGGVDGVVSFVWDQHFQGRFPEFGGDLRSSPELRGALASARRLLGG